MLEAIIFDVDGTLWDSTDIVANAWNKAAKETGIDLEVKGDDLKKVFGLPMMEIMDRLIPNETKEKKEELFTLCSKYEFEFLTKTPGKVYEGLEESLNELSQKYFIGAVSNCQSGYIDLLYKMTGLGKYFKDDLCPGDTGKLKAENIRIMMEKHGIKEAVYVGDTIMDYNACVKAEVPFVFAKYGFGQVDTPDYVIEKPLDLLEIFD